MKCSVIGAEAQKPSHNDKSKGGSDDEAPDVSIRNRKRKVIFDFSDEECEDVISLASPSSHKISPRPDGEEIKEDSGTEKPDERVSRETETDKPEVSEQDCQKTTSAGTSGVKKRRNLWLHQRRRRSRPLVLKLESIPQREE